MNHRRQFCLSLLVFIVVTCGTTFAAPPPQQTAENAPGSVSGHLTNGDKPLPGIKVRLAGPTIPRKDQQSRVAEVVTDEAGYYRFIGVASGSYQVFPVTNDYVLEDVKIADQGKFVTVLPRGDVANINFDMLMAARVHGRIAYASGRPVVRQQVFLIIVAAERNKS